LINPILL